MHSNESARKRIDELLKGRENFMTISRTLAKKAQDRESKTIQPKEKLSGIKATLTIKNYLGGNYYLTCDEVNIDKKTVYLIEGKHSKQFCLPSLEDIKDGLLKMILFTNLKQVKIGAVDYTPISILKLTSALAFSMEALKKSQLEILHLLKKESEKNRFHVLINNTYLSAIDI